MAIYPPTPAFSESDRRLLALLAKLLLEQLDPNNRPSNLPPATVALTDSEADELVENLGKLVESRRFVEACFFVEEVTKPDLESDRRLREIYLSGRSRSGRTRVAGSAQWSEFLARLGRTDRARWVSRAEPMTFSHFAKMERKLLRSAGLNPKVVDHVMHMVDEQTEGADLVRRGRKPLNHNSIKPLVTDPVFRWRKRRSKGYDWLLSSREIAAALTITADLSVLFTTRDWSVAGTVSMMVSVLAAKD